MVERLGCIFELWSDGILMQIHLHETPQTGLVHALVSHLGQLSFVTEIRAEKCWSSEARDIQITSVLCSLEGWGGSGLITGPGCGDQEHYG